MANLDVILMVIALVGVVLTIVGLGVYRLNKMVDQNAG